MILILAFFSLINGFITIFYSFFQARQKMERQALLETLQYLLMFSFGFYTLFKIPSAENLSYAYLYSTLIALLLVLLFFHFKAFPLKIRWDFSVWKKFLSISWPLALSGLFSAIYNYTDSVMLGCRGMLAETGWYNAAYKIVTASLIPAGLISGSFYPALSRFSHESKEKFQRIWHYELEIMILLALPLIVGGNVLASKIINALYPVDFSPVILAFQILILIAGITFIYKPFFDAMIALDQQAKIFWITFGGALINVILNLILIPKFSLYGAAVATFVTNFLILLIVIIFMKKFTFIDFPLLKIILTFLIAIISTFVMCFVIKQPLVGGINIFFLIFLGAAVYSVVVLLIRKYVLLKYFKQIYNA
jgi:O-antigen/teichoic acid export membrane protein